MRLRKLNKMGLGKLNRNKRRRDLNGRKSKRRNGLNRKG